MIPFSLAAKRQQPGFSGRKLAPVRAASFAEISGRGYEQVPPTHDDRVGWSPGQPANMPLNSQSI